MDVRHRLEAGSALSGRGVKRRIRPSAPTMTMGKSTVPRRLTRSLLSRVRSLLRFCISSLTVVSSSFVLCNSSLAVSSSSFVLWSSSFVLCSSSFAEVISSCVDSTLLPESADRFFSRKLFIEFLNFPIFQFKGFPRGSLDSLVGIAKLGGLNGPF